MALGPRAVFIQGDAVFLSQDGSDGYGALTGARR